jgi:inhibitor of cysteine peptidase
VKGYMKMSGVLVVVLLAGLLLVAGCGPAREADAAARGEITLGAQDNGSAVELAVGQALVIRLESNPTTGYSWQVAEIDGAVLKQVGEAAFEAQSDLLGAPGAETLRFEASGSGQATLKLVYHRPWEKDVEPLETFTVAVTVR